MPLRPPAPKIPPRAYTTTYGFAPVGTQVHVDENPPRVILYDAYDRPMTEAERPVGFKL